MICFESSFVGFAQFYKVQAKLCPFNLKSIKILCGFPAVFFSYYINIFPLWTQKFLECCYEKNKQLKLSKKAFNCKNLRNNKEQYFFLLQEITRKLEENLLVKKDCKQDFFSRSRRSENASIHLDLLYYKILSECSLTGRWGGEQFSRLM